jgi:hypothetical protein
MLWIVCSIIGGCSTSNSNNASSETLSTGKANNNTSSEQLEPENPTNKATPDVVQSDLEGCYKLPKLEEKMEDGRELFDVVGTRMAVTAGMKFHLGITEQKSSMQGNGAGMKIIRATPTQPYIDPAKRGFNFAGLTFSAICDLEVFDDGTLLTNKRGITAKDESNNLWESQEVTLNNKKVIVFLSKGNLSTGSKRK